MAAAFGTFVQIALVDVAASVADGIGNVEGEIVAPFLGRHAQQLAVLAFAQVLFQVHVQGAATRQVFDVLAAVEPELVEDVQVLVLHDVEVAVVAVTRHDVPVFLVPFGVFDTDVLGRDHLAVEHHVLAAVFLVEAFDHPEDFLDEGHVVRVVGDADAQEFGGFHQAVHADGQVLAADVDEARVEERQHTLGLQVGQVGIVGQLHLVHQFHHLLEEFHIGDAFLEGMLDAAVKIDRQHALAAGAHAAGAEGVAEAVVLDLVAQAAAGRQRVGVVAHVGEEAVAFAVHLCGPVGVFGIFGVAVFRQQGHRLDREGEDGLRALGIEPFHEALLEPGKRIPVRTAAVGEDEIAEDALEIEAVVVGNVPEHGLEIAGTGMLVDGIDDLLEAVGNDLVDGAAFLVQVHDLVGTLVVVFPVFLLDEIVHVHQEFRRGAGAAQHAGDDEHQVHESAAEALEVGRRRGVAAQGDGTLEQPRIHRDAGAVVGQAGLVVLVDVVLVEQVKVAVRQFLAVHLADAVGQQAAVEPDEAGLGQFADEGGDVLLLDVGVGVVLAAGGRVRGRAVVDQEVQAVADFAVFGVVLPVEHVGFRHGEVALAHQRDFHLVLDFFDVHPVGNVHAAEDVGQGLFSCETAGSQESLPDGVLDLVKRERGAFTVPFDDVKVSIFHSYIPTGVNVMCCRVYKVKQKIAG